MVALLLLLLALMVMLPLLTLRVLMALVVLLPLLAQALRVLMALAMAQALIALVLLLVLRLPVHEYTLRGEGVDSRVQLGIEDGLLPRGERGTTNLVHRAGMVWTEAVCTESTAVMARRSTVP